AFMCALCRIDADGKALCATCFGRLGTAGELADARTRFRHYNGIALHLSILGLPFFTFGAVLGPLAIWLAARGLKQSKKLDEPLGVGGARVAIPLGVIDAVLCV